MYIFGPNYSQLFYITIFLFSYEVTLKSERQQKFTYHIFFCDQLFIIKLNSLLIS